MEKEIIILDAIFTIGIPLLFIAVLAIVALLNIRKAVYSGSITLGYKYYKPGYTFKRKNNPIVFWMGVSFYLSGTLLSIFLIGFILQTNGVMIVR